MARYKGHQGAMTAGGEDVGEIESFEIELTVAELDANVMGTSWTDVESGQSSASGTVAVLRDPSDVGQVELVVGTKVACVFYPEGNTTGLTSITGSFMITSRGISVSVGDLVKTTYNIRNAGAVTETVVA